MTNAASIDKFAGAGRLKTKKVVQYVIPFTVIEMGPVGERDPQGYYTGLQVRLSNWVNSKEDARVYYTWPIRYKQGQEPSIRPVGKVYILKSQDDSTSYACSHAQFDGDCFATTTLEGPGLKNYAEKVKP